MNEEQRTALCTRMAEELPVLRKAMGATQVRFAEIAGVTRNTVINIERNKTMGWPAFLSFLMIFSKQEDTMKLIRAFDLYPAELDDFLSGKITAEG